MFRRSRPHARSTAFLASLLLAALLPGGVHAASPAAANDEFTVGVNAPETGLDVLLNDTDPDGDALRVVDVTEPANGTAAPSVDGSMVTYQPNADFRGIETFEYLVEDSSLGTSSGTVTVMVNDPPIAVDDPGTGCGAISPGGGLAFGGAYFVPEDYVGSWPPTDYLLTLCGLLLNDTDPNGDSLTWEFVTQPAHGDAINLDGFHGYRPNPNYSTKPGDQPGGEWVSDSFTYRAFDGLSYSQPATMRYWVAPINDPPTFTPGGDVTVAQDSGHYSGTWATNVSPGPTNESDQTVHFQLLPGMTVVQHGPANLFVDLPAIDSDGVLTFTIAPDVYGQAHVTFWPQDDGGTLPDYAQGTDTPKADDSADDVSFDIVVTSNALNAADDDLDLPEDPDTFPPFSLPNPWPIDVMANDTFPSGATIVAVTQGTLGVVTIAADGRSVFYAPDLDANGTDSFTYTLDDGAGTTDTATVRLTIDPVDDLPRAVDDSLTVPRNAPATVVPVLDNDSEVDGETLTIVGKTDGSKGTVVITGGGTGLTYQPDRGAIGTDSFTYTITDDHGSTATATVQLTIAPKGHNGPR